MSDIIVSYLKIAIKAAKLAGEFIQQSASSISTLKIEQKSANDFVSEVDRKAESIIVDVLSSAYPDHTIVGEEHGAKVNQDTRRKWIVDPLDGTTNFLRSIPHYSVSIALLIDAQIEVAVVYDPSKDDLFYAEKGHGAFLNGREISVNELASLQSGLYSTGIPFNGKGQQQIASFTNTMHELLDQQTSGIRRLGSAALDLAYVACGRYDGFWESNLKSWDIAAGILLVTEAGGLVSDFQGGQDQLESGNIVATGKNIHPDFVKITQKHY